MGAGVSPSLDRRRSKPLYPRFGNNLMRDHAGLWPSQAWRLTPEARARDDTPD
ncbi:hypothetical protein BN903_308 [Halorubrum sp. AJ67]|nr:hypothetical protein BN903_308 [Halorubrum sp. AJ67]